MFAGKAGLCPTCRARIDVPQRQTRDMSEDAILDILGPGSQETAVSMTATSDTSTRSIQERDGREKECYKCQRVFPLTMHVCPFCHTYIANLRDF